MPRLPLIFALSLVFADPLSAFGQDGGPLGSNSAAIPPVQPLVLNDPVPVPETFGASLLAGVGFLLMFRRRRFSR